MTQWTINCCCSQKSHGPFYSKAAALKAIADLSADESYSECWPISPDPEPIEMNLPVAMFVAKPEIEPHFNRSLGCHVESRKHLEHLQETLGCTDAVVTGDAERYIPRDFEEQGRQAQRQLEESDRLAADAPPDDIPLEEVTYVGEE